VAVICRTAVAAAAAAGGAVGLPPHPTAFAHASAATVRVKFLDLVIA
jgi:hypothetical protein